MLERLVLNSNKYWFKEVLEKMFSVPLSSLLVIEHEDIYPYGSYKGRDNAPNLCSVNDELCDCYYDGLLVQDHSWAALHCYHQWLNINLWRRDSWNLPFCANESFLESPGSGWKNHLLDVSIISQSPSLTPQVHREERTAGSLFRTEVCAMNLHPTPVLYSPIWV